MSQELRTAFLDNPLTFAQDHLLYIASTPVTHFKHKDGYDSVESADRVLYWDIVGEGDSGHAEYCSLELSRDEQEGWLPGFWLPWTADTVRKITLHDKRDNEVKERTGPPRAFFTATVNGCSVFVEGERATPTVYHTNAVSASIGDRESDRRTLRAKLLEGRIRAVHTPKRGHGDIQLVLHPSLYMSGQLPALDYEPMAATENASVFGTCTEHGWSFYCQPYYYLLSETGKHYPKKPAFEFWPTGGGRVATSATPERGTIFVSEKGATGYALRAHLMYVLEKYSSRWKSAESKNAIIQLTAMQHRDHATILRAFHHYLGLDSSFQAYNHGLGARLKTDSTLYGLLMTEYKEWLGV